jgi:PAT family beta-lactamase induction signal transducer AmpG
MSSRNKRGVIAAPPPAEPPGKVLQQPWSFVPTMGLFQSLVFCSVSVLPGLFLKSTGASNEMVGLASLLALPIAFRFLAGMAVDRRGSIRAWSLVTQLLSTATAVGAALSVLAGAPLGVTLGLFALAGFIAAFQDVATDGFFLFAVPPERKAFYCNLKVQIYRVGLVIGQGLYVMLAGRLILDHHSPSEAWGRVFLLHALVLAGLLIWNALSFPKRVTDDMYRGNEATTFRWFVRMIVDFVRMPGMVWALAFIAIFRVGESALTAMKAPFLLDPIVKGGLGLSLQDVGFLNGVLVFGISILGGIAGGLWVQRKGLRGTLVPAVLLLNLPNAVFFWLALHPPAAGSMLGLQIPPAVVVGLAAEGVANSVALAPFIYLLIVCAQGRHRASLFAFVSGVMNLGWILPGTVSGYLQKAMGYPALFFTLTLVGLPVLLLIRRMPLARLEAEGRGGGATGF